MNPRIEELISAKDVQCLIEMLWSRDGNDAASALEKINHPAVIDPLIDFLSRRDEFMQWDVNRYKELWRDRPESTANPDYALADYQAVQFSAIRIFERFGGAKTIECLEQMARSDPDSDIREGAGRAIDACKINKN